MKRVILCMVTFILALSSWSTEGAPKEEKKIESKMLSYVAHGPATTQYAQAAGQATVLIRYSGLKVAVSATSGAGATVPLLGTGEAHIGMLHFMHLWAHSRGTGGLKKPYPELRVLQAGYASQYGLLVPKASNIKTPADLRGKTVGLFIKGLGPQQINAVIPYYQLLAYGVDPEKDIKRYEPDSVAGAMKDLGLGIVDAVCTSVIAPANVELHATKPIEVVPFPKEKMGIYDKYGLGYVVGYFPMAVDAPISPGVPAVGCQNVLAASKDLDEDTAYLIVKTLIEHQKELIDIDKNFFRDWSLENAVRKAPGPYHPGAIKYYKERGLWTKEMEEHQKKLLEEFAKIEKSLPKK